MTFDRFFDDAAIFPPGNAPLDVALKEHLARSGTADERYVGPLVVDTARLPELVTMLTEPMNVIVVSRSTVASERSEWVGAGTVMAAGDHYAVEKPWGSGYEVPDGALLKLRCGGDYLPTVAELADAISWCVEHDQPFKLTAGLHAAIATGEAHGFVNIMAAVVAAMRDEDPVPALMAWADELDFESLGEARRLFRSVGTCDIDGPLADLRQLGLIP